MANYSPFFRLNEEHFTFQLQYKHSGTFATVNMKNMSYPKKSENVRPPSSGTSPLAAYKELSPPPPGKPLSRVSLYEPGLGVKNAVSKVSGFVGTGPWLKQTKMTIPIYVNGMRKAGTLGIKNKESTLELV